MISGSAATVLFLGPAHERAQDVVNLLRKRGLPADRLEIDHSPSRRALRSANVLVCVLEPQGPDFDAGRIRKLLDRARAENVAALVWGVPDNFESPSGELIDCLPADVGLEEVVGRLTALARYAPVLKRMDKELQRLQRLGQHLNRYFDEIDQELRLAGRLQRDFLPRELPAPGPLRFAQLYRPAGWVSGDIYDVFQIDERQVGMFIADVMGHGTAAGLMTMFLRRALVPTQGNGSGMRVLPPAEAMRALHEGFVRQDLPSAQFLTAAYAIIDLESWEMRLARGGHPYPLHVTADGQIREIRCEGGLLGLAGLDLAFEEHRTRLARGDKVVFYTDGLEELFMLDRDPKSGLPRFTPHLLRWARLDAEAFVAAVGEHLDQQEGSLNPVDDITAVIAELRR